MNIFLGVTRTHVRDRLSSREIWREAKLQQQRNNAQEQLRRISEMVAAVSRIVERLRLGGVYGPLYTLFEVTDHIYIPPRSSLRELGKFVRTCFVNWTPIYLSLWHVVVDTDATVSKLLEVMLKEKTGRVAFMPWTA